LKDASFEQVISMHILVVPHLSLLIVERSKSGFFIDYTTDGAEHLFDRAGNDARLTLGTCQMILALLLIHLQASCNKSPCTENVFPALVVP
jgi:hypothetical protein